MVPEHTDAHVAAVAQVKRIVTNVAQTHIGGDSVQASQAEMLISAARGSSNMPHRVAEDEEDSIEILYSYNVSQRK